jgi:hypothetical protein
MVNFPPSYKVRNVHITIRFQIKAFLGDSLPDIPRDRYTYIARNFCLQSNTRVCSSNARHVVSPKIFSGMVSTVKACIFSNSLHFEYLRTNQICIKKGKKNNLKIHHFTTGFAEYVSIGVKKLGMTSNPGMNQIRVLRHIVLLTNKNTLTAELNVGIERQIVTDLLYDEVKKEFYKINLTPSVEKLAVNP